MVTVVTFAPLKPPVDYAPRQVAPDTWLIQQVQPALGQPLFIYLNSLVILAKEPVIVDTGTPANRHQWLEDVFAIVEPEDVRWVFLSHDDVDHTGNLDQVMEACPNATLVVNWAMQERHTNAFNFPLERCIWNQTGDSFDVGDRTLLAVRPPVYDSPTTRGLYDPKNELYWSVDTFAAPMTSAPTENAAEVDVDFWQEGMTLFAFGAISAWLPIVDPAKFADTVAAIQIGTGRSGTARRVKPLLGEKYHVLQIHVAVAVKIAGRTGSLHHAKTKEQNHRNDGYLL